MAIAEFFSTLAYALQRTFEFQTAGSFFGYIMRVLDDYGDVAVAFWAMFP